MQKNILIIGGTGLIGSTISRILKARNQDYTLFIGSRKKSNSEKTLNIDVNDFATFSVILKHRIDLMVLCTNDKHNNALHYEIANHIDYIDITKPTPDLTTAFSIANQETGLQNRIIFSSGWMGGIVPGLLSDTHTINAVKLFVYYSIHDKAGESSAHFMAENVNKPFVCYKNNKPVTIKHFLDSEKHSFSSDIGKDRFIILMCRICLS